MIPGFICAACGKPAVRKLRTQRYCPECSDAKHAGQKEAARGTSPRRKIADHAKRRAAAIVSVEARESMAWDANEALGIHRLIRVAIPFTYRMSKNATWSMGERRGHVFVRQEIKRLRAGLSTLIVSALGGVPFLEGRLWIDILVEKPNHRGDAINMIDGVCDAVKVATGIDDRWYSIRRVDWRVVKTEPRIIVGIGQAITEPERVCSYCGTVKPLTSFGKRKHGVGGRARVCIECGRIDRRLGGRSERAVRGYVPDLPTPLLPGLGVGA